MNIAQTFARVICQLRQPDLADGGHVDHRRFADTTWA